jgi:hypothetical protein
LPQQFRAARRSRSENERRQIHAANLGNTGRDVERRSTLEFKLQLALGTPA